MDRGFLDGADLAVRTLARWLGYLAAFSIAGIVILLAGSSIRRYLLGTPLAVTEELTALLFMTLSFLSLAEGFVTGRQIRILALWRRLPARLQGPMMIVGQLMTLVVLAVVIHATFGFAAASYAFGSRSYVSEILLWPWMMVIPFGLGICFLAVLVRMAVDVRALRRGEPLQAPTAPEADERAGLEP